jgi:signal transduction histidine kinase
MGEVGVLAFARAGDELERVSTGPVAVSAGQGEVETLRRRLARLAFDVHDGPMQDLIAVSWRLGSAHEQAVNAVGRGESAALAAVFDGLAADLGRVEKGLRALMLALEHNEVSHRALRVPVHECVAEFQRHAFARVEVSVTGDVEPRTDSQRIALERVLCESLANIAKHAHADHVAVSLRGTAESIQLEVRDDGRGFVPDATPTFGHHIGIRAMRERLRMLGGTLTVDSCIGGPTVVMARISKWQASDGVSSTSGALGG